LMGVGSFLAGLVSGPLADRFDRRGMMLCCDTLAVLLYGAIPLWWWLIGPQGVLLLVVAAPLGFVSIAATVAGTASIPRLVERTHLVQANSSLQVSTALAFVIGPVLAGPLVGLLGAPNVLALNAASYLISVGSLALIRLRPAPEDTGAMSSGHLGS